jgi:putative transposase
MVPTPQDHRWSSYRATAGLEAAPEWLAIEELIPYFGDGHSWQRNYREYVAEAITTPDRILRGLRRGIFLGTEEWLRKTGRKVTVAWRRTDIPHDQRAALRPSMGEILGAISRALRTSRADIRRRGGGLARAIAAWLGVYEGRRRLRVIAQTLRLRSCSRVTQLVAECERRMRRDRSVRKLIEQLRLGVA